MSLLNLVAKLTLDTSEYESSLGKAESSAGGFGKKFGGAVKKVAAVGVKAFTAATAAIGSFGVASVKTGQEFDKSMSQVAATMGMTVADMESDVQTVDLAWGKFTGNLRDYAQEMGANTAFSAKQSADALNYMALAGYDTLTSMQMLPNVMNLAAAGAMDLARASDMVTDTQTAFGIGLERTSQLVDEMAKAASTGNTSVEQLGDAFLVVGGLAQELNGGFVALADGTKAPVDGIQEMEIALTAMANAGIKGSAAGTHMRNMIMKLSSPTKEGVAELEALGVTVFDDTGKMRSFKDLMGDLSVKLGNLTQKQKIKAISKLFNARDLASAEALLNAVNQDWDAIGESILNAEGAAQKMADTQLDNLAGDMTLFRSALEGAQIAVSDNLSPSLRDFVKEGTKGLSDFTKTLKSGDVIGAINSLGETFGNLAGIAISKVPDMVRAGGALLGGLVRGIASAVSKIDFGHIVLPMILGLSGKLRESAKNLTVVGVELLKGIGSGIENNSSYLSNIISSIFANIYGIVTDNVPVLLEAALSAIEMIGSGISEGLLDFLANTVLPFALNISEFLREQAGSFVDVGINFILNIAQGLMDSLPTLLEQLPQIVINIAGVINDNAPKLLVGGVKLIAMIIKGIISAIPSLIANFPQIFQAVLAVWSALNWLNMGKSVITWIKNGIENLKTQIPNALKDIGKKAIEFFKTVDWRNAGTQAINFIVNAIRGLFSLIPNTLKSIGGSAVSAFKSINWFDLGANIIRGIVNGISSNVGVIVNAAKNAAKSAFDAAKRFLGIESPSKLFRKEVGAMIPKGAALGIKENAYVAEKASEDLAEDIFEPFDDVDYWSNGPSIETTETVIDDNGINDAIMAILEFLRNNWQAENGEPVPIVLDGGALVGYYDRQMGSRTNLRRRGVI